MGATADKFDPWIAAAAVQSGATTKSSAESRPEEFQLYVDGDTVPDADIITACASTSAAMSAYAQAFIAALNQQIAGVNFNIQGKGPSFRVDAQLATFDRRLNGQEEPFRALDEKLQRVDVSGGGGTASTAGSSSTAAGASSANASTAWAIFRPNLGPVLMSIYASRPQENSVDAECAKPLKRRLIRTPPKKHSIGKDHPVAG